MDSVAGLLSNEHVILNASAMFMDVITQYDIVRISTTPPPPPPTPVIFSDIMILTDEVTFKNTACNMTVSITG